MLSSTTLVIIAVAGVALVAGGLAGFIFGVYHVFRTSEAEAAATPWGPPSRPEVTPYNPLTDSVQLVVDVEDFIEQHPAEAPATLVQALLDLTSEAVEDCDGASFYRLRSARGQVLVTYRRLDLPPVAPPVLAPTNSWVHVKTFGGHADFAFPEGKFSTPPVVVPSVEGHRSTVVISKVTAEGFHAEVRSLITIGGTEQWAHSGQARVTFFAQARPTVDLYHTDEAVRMVSDAVNDFLDEEDDKARGDW